jgi:hypothetical protein
MALLDVVTQPTPVMQWDVGMVVCKCLFRSLLYPLMHIQGSHQNVATILKNYSEIILSPRANFSYTSESPLPSTIPPMGAKYSITSMTKSAHHRMRSSGHATVPARPFGVAAC